MSRSECPKPTSVSCKGELSALFHKTNLFANKPGGNIKIAFSFIKKSSAGNSNRHTTKVVMKRFTIQCHTVKTVKHQLYKGYLIGTLF